MWLHTLCKPHKKASFEKMEDALPGLSMVMKKALSDQCFACIRTILCDQPLPVETVLGQCYPAFKPVTLYFAFYRKCSNPVNYLRQQLLMTLQEVLLDDGRPFCSHYGALVGLTELGTEVNVPFLSINPSSRHLRAKYN